MKALELGDDELMMFIKKDDRNSFCKGMSKDEAMFFRIWALYDPVLKELNGAVFKLESEGWGLRVADDSRKPKEDPSGYLVGAKNMIDGNKAKFRIVGFCSDGTFYIENVDEDRKVGCDGSRLKISGSS
jgi:hypothetical protein